MARHTLNSIDVLLFDWDGTLFDSATPGFLAFERTFQDLGVFFDREFYDANYSPNWYTMYESLALPRADWERADQLWLEHYGEQPAILVEGAQDALMGMSSRGYRLGVVTSGTGKRVKREMKELGIEALFEAVVCNEHIANKKPHPEGLEVAMTKMHVIADRCCYVGDTPEDIQMGRNAGVFTIGVPSAYPSNRLLRDANPNLYVDSTRDLLMHFPGRGPV